GSSRGVVSISSGTPNRSCPLDDRPYATSADGLPGAVADWLLPPRLPRRRRRLRLDDPGCPACDVAAVTVESAPGASAGVAAEPEAASTRRACAPGWGCCCGC